MDNRLIKKIIKIITPKKIKSFLLEEELKDHKKRFDFATLSYSQEGEDLILNRFLENKKSGFYVDIGAHHPRRFSNTYNFYKKGWHGINIDPMPGIMEAFNKERPRDINIEIGVSGTEQQITYYMFNEPALNTFSKKEADLKDGLRTYKVVEKKIIKTVPLKKLLDEFLPTETIIDFMTIDVEGLDLEVLKSNDWIRYRPNVLLVEDLIKQSLSEFQNNSPIFRFLNQNNYVLIGKTFNTFFFKNNEN